MKNTILTLALITSIGAFAISSQGIQSSPAESAVVCEGEHKCDDKCKKDKKGNCTEVKASAENKGETAKACCKKGEKSCKGKKAKIKKGKTEPKS